MDRAAIFTTILQRQALRREALLPLLDVRAEYERAVEQAMWSAHLARHYAFVRAEVLTAFRAKHGAAWGYSAGGRWAIEIETDRKLKAKFDQCRQ